MHIKEEEVVIIWKNTKEWSANKRSPSETSDGEHAAWGVCGDV